MAKITKENLVKEIHSQLLGLNVLKELCKNEIPAVKIQYETYRDTNKSLFEYKCPVCGHRETKYVGSSERIIPCICGIKLIKDGYYYNKFAYREINELLNGSKPDKVEVRTKILHAVNNGELKGAICYNAVITGTYNGDKIDFSSTFDKNSPIVFYGTDGIKKFDCNSGFSMKKYLDSTVFVGDFVSAFGCIIMNKYDVKGYYEQLKRQKATTKKSMDCSDDNLRFASLNFKGGFKTDYIPFFCKNIVKTDNIKNIYTYDVYCPNCKKHFQFEKSSKQCDNDEGACPNCGAEYTNLHCIKYYGDIYNKIEISVVGDDIAIVVKNVKSAVNKSQKDMIDTTVEDANVFFTIGMSGENKGLITKYDVDGGKIVSRRRNVETGKSMYFRTYQIVSGKDALKYTGLEAFLKYAINKYSNPTIFDITKYLSYVIKYPVFEKLVNAGFSYKVMEILWDKKGDAETTHDFHADTLHDFFKVPKYIFKIGSKYFGTEEYKMNMLLKINDITGMNSIDIKDIEYMCEYYLGDLLNVIVDIAEMSGASLSEQLAYIERVRVNQCIRPREAISLWRDYIRAAQKIGVNVRDKSAKYPSSLKREHDIVAYKASLIRNTEQQEKFKKHVQTYAQQYAWDVKDEDFIITYPKSIEELFEEGRVLCHCVGAYADSIIKGNDVILFLRNRKTADVPYYTMNVNPKTNEVVEIATFANKKLNPKDEPELFEFLKKWCSRKNISGLKRCI